MQDVKLFDYEVVCRYDNLEVCRGVVAATSYADAANSIDRYFAENLVSMGLQERDTPFVDYDDEFFKENFGESDIQLPHFEICRKETH